MLYYYYPKREESGQKKRITSMTKFVEYILSMQYNIKAKKRRRRGYNIHNQNKMLKICW